MNVSEHAAITQSSPQSLFQNKRKNYLRSSKRSIYRVVRHAEYCTLYKCTGCFTITVKSNFSSFMTFFDVLTFPMSVLCITGWDIYVFSHESSETIKNIWFSECLLCGLAILGKKTIYSVFDPNWSKSFRNGPKW